MFTANRILEEKLKIEGWVENPVTEGDSKLLYREERLLLLIVCVLIGVSFGAQLCLVALEKSL